MNPIKDLIKNNNVITVYYYTREPAFSALKSLTESYIREHANKIFETPGFFNKIEKVCDIR
jgi:hypothetical protein